MKMIEKYPDQVFCRDYQGDYQGRLPLQLCVTLLDQESELGCNSTQSPQLQISKLIRKEMSRIAQDAVVEMSGVCPASLAFWRNHFFTGCGVSSDGEGKKILITSQCRWGSR